MIECMKTYLVTGSDGHLGGTIVSLLTQKGCRVRGLRLKGSPLATPKLEEVYEGDVTVPASLDPFFDVEEDAVCIHTAGLISIASGNDKRIFAVNVQGTEHVIDACKRHGINKLVYVSSVHAIPVQDGIITETKRFDPDLVEGPYGKSKAMATALVLGQTDVPVVVAHPSGILGPGDWGRGHLTGLVRDYLTGKLRFCVKGGYDIVDVRDVAEGIISAADNGRAGETYILSGSWHEVKEILDDAATFTGAKKAGCLPLFFAKMTAPIAEWYYRLRHSPMLYSRYALRVLEDKTRFSHEKATRELGFTVRPLQETVNDTIIWMRKNGMLPAANGL